MSLGVNVLTSGPKILHMTKRDILQATFFRIG